MRHVLLRSTTLPALEELYFSWRVILVPSLIFSA